MTSAPPSLLPVAPPAPQAMLPLGALRGEGRARHAATPQSSVGVVGLPCDDSTWHCSPSGTGSPSVGLNTAFICSPTGTPMMSPSGSTSQTPLGVARSRTHSFGLNTAFIATPGETPSSRRADQRGTFVSFADFAEFTDRPWVNSPTSRAAAVGPAGGHRQEAPFGLTCTASSGKAGTQLDEQRAPQHFAAQMRWAASSGA
mmetsp:Transcript_2063/g.5002  ORF Transcript_2063/g.5002 Transcript_2063/m.5002 type:complete len:201 (+) Transcript_2063:54-656(+)